jgi:multidrug efflux pump subunit AcrA (membrane-fusion protein)
MKRIIFFIIISGVIIGGNLFIQHKKQEALNEKTAFVHVYTPLETVNKNSLSSFETFSAKLESIQNPQITTKISGHVTNIFVKQNQEVKKGDVLVMIDDLEHQENMTQIHYSIESLKSGINSLQLSLHALKLDMNLSNKEYDTNKKIYKIGGISKDKLDSSHIAFEQKKANYTSALKTIESKKNELNAQNALLNSKKKLQNYYTLSSPIDGFVEDVFVDVGDLGSSNKPLVSLLSKEQKLSFLFVNERIKKNQAVFIEAKKVGVINEISISSKNYMKEAIIKLDKPLPYTHNSLVSIEVKTDD